MNNFNLINADTDSIMVNKTDGSPFTKQEQEFLLKELNSLYPELIRFEDDGYFSRVIVVKAKNYIMKENELGKVKIKGSAFKDSKKEIALQEFLKEMLTNILDNGLNYENLRGVYQKYLNEIDDIQNIKRWSQKKTVTDKILKCAGHKNMTPEEKKELGIRKNETDVYDAIENKVSQEGDKIFLYPVSYKTVETNRVGVNGRPLKDKIIVHNSLRTIESWTGSDHDKEKLKARLEATLKILCNVLDVNEILS